jgi:hypothetical protein
VSGVIKRNLGKIGKRLLQVPTGQALVPRTT